jgi:hypothetical protein
MVVEDPIDEMMADGAIVMASHIGSPTVHHPSQNNKV